MVHDLINNSFLKAIRSSNELEYVNCLAHLLNLVVKELFAATSIMPLLEKCRKLVGTFKHSTSLSEKLAITIRNLKSTARLLCADDDDDLEPEVDVQEPSVGTGSLRTRLVQDLVTRWNSTLAMLSSINESHAAIRMVITSDQDIRRKYQHELLTDNELGVVEDLILLLDPFLEMTKLISGQKYVTISIVLPAVTRLSECLHLFEPSTGN